MRHEDWSEVRLIVTLPPLNLHRHPAPFFVLLNFNLLAIGRRRRGSDRNTFVDKREGLEIFLAETWGVGRRGGGREKRA